jgi:hypothetical protein
VLYDRRGSHVKIHRPDKWVVAKHTGPDGVERTKFVGYVSSAIPDGKGNLRVTTTGPEQLVTEQPLPFPAPLAEQGSDAGAFEFWWKQLAFVFELPDPQTFPALPDPLPDERQTVVDRYISVAEELAQSRVIGAAEEGFTVRIDDHTDETAEVLARLPSKEIQLGFAGLLRQLDSKDEHASFSKTCDAIWLAADAAKDRHHTSRLDQLQAWRRAAGQLHANSLNQVLRKKLVSEHGFAVLDYEEMHTPQFLLSAYGYGDFLHWGRKKGVVAAFEQDELSAAEHRSAFLTGAMGLAHLYMGFAVVARAATSN